METRGYNWQCMAGERERESFEGYRTGRLQEVRGSIKMPQSWYFWSGRREDEQATVFTMTRDPVNSVGYFKTGMVIVALPEFGKKNTPVVDAIEPFLREEPPGAVLATGPFIDRSNGAFEVGSSTFVASEPQSIEMPTEHGLVVQTVDPTIFVRMVFGNKLSETLYLGRFQTPIANWEEDKTIPIKMFAGWDIDLTY